MGFITARNRYVVKDYSNARDAALFVLLEVCENRHKSNAMLKEVFETAQAKGTPLGNTDRAFTERIVIGTLDRLISIDEVLSGFVKRGMNRQKPLVRAVLRMSAYQILYMDRVPDSAACNEGVRLIKLHGMEGMSGFVNGVLRSLVREKEGGGIDSILNRSSSVRYSLPAWMCELFDRQYGSSVAAKICEAFLKERRETLRFNISRVPKEHIADCGALDAESYIVSLMNADGFELERIDMEALAHTSVYSDMPDAVLPIMYALANGGDIASSRAFKAGYVTVQDPASAFTASFAAPVPGSTVIDVCAAPGGKSLAIAELMSDGCHIEARDVSERKVSLINENVARCGYSNINVRVLDALESDEDSLYRADVLIADLPCSGLGVIAKKPDIKINLASFGVTELQQLQRDILMNVSSFIKPKGRLIYSTCTLSREENEDNAAWLISELGFKKLKEFKLLPGADNDGFYIAVFKKGY